MDQLIRDIPGLSWQILVKGELMETPKNNYYLQKMLQVAQQLGQPLKPVKEHGASDGRFFSALGIPVIMFKPQASQAHQDHEWIDLESLKVFRQLLKTFLLEA